MDTVAVGAHELIVAAAAERGRNSCAAVLVGSARTVDVTIALPRGGYAERAVRTAELVRATRLVGCKSHATTDMQLACTCSNICTHAVYVNRQHCARTCP